MSQEGTSDQRLMELTALCKKGREHKKRPRYGEEARALFLALIDGGMTPTEIVQATGISPEGARKWVRTRSSAPAVKILKVQPSSVPAGGQETLLLVKTREFEVAVYRPRSEPV